MKPLNVEWLRSFLAIADEGSFTGAAKRLGVLQSTMSQRVARLEEALGRPLLERDTHRVAMTPDGQAMVGLARDVVAANERVRGFFSATGLRDRIRLGVSEDFTQLGLADVLARFADRNSAVDLQLTVGLSSALYHGFDAGELDVIFAKRRAGDPRGQLVWRERLVWVGRPGFVPDPAAALPLVLYPPPSITRKLAVEAVERAKRSWRVACTSGSMMGLRAATEAGLGIASHSAKLVPASLAVIPTGAGLPALGEIEFVVIGPGRHHAVATALTEALLASLAELRLV